MELIGKGAPSITNTNGLATRWRTRAESHKIFMLKHSKGKQPGVRRGTELTAVNDMRTHSHDAVVTHMTPNVTGGKQLFVTTPIVRRDNGKELPYNPCKRPMLGKRINGPNAGILSEM